MTKGYKFLEEATNSAKLSHQNMIRILDADKRGKYTFIVMEYVDGRTLDDYLNQHGAIKISNAIKIMLELCKVLDYASKLGLIHRDIKPGNIMLTKRQEVKLADFGLAKIINAPEKYQTLSGQIYGTPFYMSPEQFMDSNNVTEKSDMYSLGATLYHLITGKVPFATNNIVQIIHMQINEKPVPPIELIPNMPEKLSKIIMKLLEKAPENRYQDYYSLSNDLKSSLDIYYTTQHQNTIKEKQGSETVTNVIHTSIKNNMKIMFDQ